MKAIIVAAGRGRRLGPETAEIPKCMVKVAGQPILHRQLAALGAAGVTEAVIVRGYLGGRILAAREEGGNARPTIRFVDNPDWASNNILASLFYAEDKMEGGFVFSYSDIVFAPSVARAVVRAEHDVGLVIDRDWSAAYQGRTLHPVSEAELARVHGGVGGGSGAEGAAAVITRVGKQAVPPEQAAGEFIGLARFSASGADALRRSWQQARRRGLDAPFGRAAALRNAYLTDALNDMADAGVRLSPVLIEGTWREIDTEQDLERAHAVVDAWS